jgi:hypothetical protein
VALMRSHRHFARSSEHSWLSPQELLTVERANDPDAS